MEKAFNIINIFWSVAAGTMAFMFGAWDMILWALIIIMSLDYITGIIKAVYNKQVSSGIGFKGILKKITILVVVVLANIIQVLTGGNVAIREIVIMFYIVNESISILENVAAVSTKMPEQLKNILLQLRNKSE